MAAIRLSSGHLSGGHLSGRTFVRLDICPVTRLSGSLLYKLPRLPGE